MENGAALADMASTYNGCCAAGEDKDLAKDTSCLEAVGDGSYYEVKMGGYCCCTCAALDVNTEFPAPDTEGPPVSGLYAVGGDGIRERLFWHEIYFKFCSIILELDT